MFKLKSKFQPAGDQPGAIKEIVETYKQGQRFQTLLGVTGSGKTFTMAHCIEQLKMPTLIMAPNKTLAAQLYGEFKDFFPENAVEYFVSYYDYYQPEAFIPSTNTFIEKDSAINEQIDRMRHSATRSLLEREDVIIVSSVSCIYGLGSPEEYLNQVVTVEVNQQMTRDQFLKELVRVQYKRQDVDFDRGCFRVRGDRVEIHPPYEEEIVIRVEFFGNFIEEITLVDPVRMTPLKSLRKASVYPASHYVTSDEKMKQAMSDIREELRHRLNELEAAGKMLEAERLNKRTQFDLEMMLEMGFCPGIENYSRHMTRQQAGEAPPTLIEYFPKKFLTLIDESHVTVPQVGGMYRGDRARKSTLVEHGFRLPSALDNRPLNFEEFEKLNDHVLYVSATPGDYEKNKTGGQIVEQIIRPTGLLDPEIEVRPATGQVKDVLGEIKKVVAQNFRVLVTTLTKKSSEDLTQYLNQHGVQVRYLHSDIKTVERTEILRDLRLGVFDVLVGINLLREGLDLPEVSLVAILDADKEGFLRSKRSLVQTIGRAARNEQGRVILYADKITESMEYAMSETSRRRKLQIKYNIDHGMTPKTIIRPVKEGLLEMYSAAVDPDESLQVLKNKVQQYRDQKGGLPKEITKLKKKMKKASEELEFEVAANIRDEIKRLQLMDMELAGD